MPIEFTVKESKRIDKVVREQLSYATLGDIFKLFRRGDIKLNGKRVKGKEFAEVHSRVAIYADPNRLRKNAQTRQESKASELSDKHITVIYEDENLFVCDKPTGVSVQSGRGVPKGGSLEEIAVHYGKSQTPPFMPLLVHRLDLDTSGVLLFSKKKEFLELLIDLFRAKSIDKTYIALCYGTFRQNSGTIRASLARSNSKSQGMKVRVVSNGKPAHSEYKVLKQYRDMALVEVKILTGRTHQIRVHMNHIGHPVVGDQRYGNHDRDKIVQKKLGSKLRLCLHARTIGFVNPVTKKNEQFSAEMPKIYKKIGTIR